MCWSDLGSKLNDCRNGLAFPEGIAVPHYEMCGGPEPPLRLLGCLTANQAICLRVRGLCERRMSYLAHSLIDSTVIIIKVYPTSCLPYSSFALDGLRLRTATVHQP